MRYAIGSSLVDFGWRATRRFTGPSKESLKSLLRQASALTGRVTKHAKAPPRSIVDRKTARQQQLLSLSRRFPMYESAVGADWINFQPASADGFSVGLALDAGRATVSFGNFYEDVASVQYAVALIEEALEGRIELRIDYNGSKSFRWTVLQIGPDGELQEFGSMSLAFSGKTMPTASRSFRNGLQLVK